MAPGDNPPIGILLCTKSEKEMVKCAMDGIDKSLFVQEYSPHMPSEEFSVYRPHLCGIKSIYSAKLRMNR